jgi:uncharacterized protein (TIGR03435 family)
MSQIVGVTLGVIVAGVGIATAQTADRAPEFAAVSIKNVSAPPPCFAMDGEMHRDSTLIDYRAVRLVDVIQEAYAMEVQFGSGPRSIWTQRYDIQARIPDGTPSQQVPAMLRRLLVERFELKVHALTGEHDVYWLLVGKDRLKLRPHRSRQGRNGDACMLGIMPKAGVGVRIVASGFTMPMIATSLSFRLETAVLDKTATQGAFDFEAEYLPPKSQLQWDLAIGPFVAVNLPERLSVPAAVPYPPIADALEEQLGLKLERHVVSTDLLVVDHANVTADRH